MQIQPSDRALIEPILGSPSQMPGGDMNVAEVAEANFTGGMGHEKKAAAWPSRCGFVQFHLNSPAFRRRKYPTRSRVPCPKFFSLTRSEKLRSQPAPTFVWRRVRRESTFIAASTA